MNGGIPHVRVDCPPMQSPIDRPKNAVVGPRQSKRRIRLGEGCRIDLHLSQVGTQHRPRSASISARVDSHGGARPQRGPRRGNAQDTRIHGSRICSDVSQSRSLPHPRLRPIRRQIDALCCRTRHKHAARRLRERRDGRAVQSVIQALPPIHCAGAHTARHWNHRQADQNPRKILKIRPRLDIAACMLASHRKNCLLAVV